MNKGVHMRRIFLSVLLVAGLLVVAATVLAGPARAATDRVEFSLTSDLGVAVDRTGAVSLLTDTGPLELLGLGGAPRGHGIRPAPRGFLALTAEGAEHGLRGFSPGADDDRDGLVDEDRLDGRDNDGDGLVDEDFAAIGDRMAVWDGGPEAVHAEFRSWSYDYLKPILFMSLQSAIPVARTLTSPLPWIPVEMDVPVRVSGRRYRAVTMSAWLTVSRTASGQETWLGILPLRGPEPSPEGLGRLAVKVGVEPTDLALVTAASWSRLIAGLGAALDVQRGVTDPLTGKREPWMAVPAIPASAAAGSGAWRLTADGVAELTLSLPTGTGRLPDPSSLAVEGENLEGCESLTLIFGSTRRTLPVTPAFTYQDLLRGRPLPTPFWAAVPEVLADDGDLQMIFTFGAEPSVLQGRAPGSTCRLGARGLDGQKWSGELTILEPETPDEQEREAGETPEGLVLSPDLMLGWPNPFRDRCQISCRVPATAEEAFATPDSQDSPDAREAGPDKTTLRLPWTDGEPTVSVRVYNLNGQELRTLFAGRRGPGEFIVQWDGTDNFGRPVASGPYLCKFQLDGLSVTRRLVYLR